MSYKVTEEGNISTVFLDGEIDMGLGSSIDSLCTIVVQDPNFGTVCYGGNLEITEYQYKIYSMDGIRRKLNIRLMGLSIDIELDQDQISNNEPIFINTDLELLSFYINNTTNDDHDTILKVSSLDNNPYRIFVNAQHRIDMNQNKGIEITIPLIKDLATFIEIKKYKHYLNN